MAYHLHLVAEEGEGLEEAVDFGVEREGCLEVPHVVEVVGRVAHFDASHFVPVAAHLGGVHAVVEADVGGDVDVFEDIEGG